MSSLAARVGFLAVGRPTFDLAFGEAFASRAAGVLRELGILVVGNHRPVIAVDRVEAASEAWSDLEIDALVIAQATFSDSTLAMAAAATTSAPVVLWASPEPRGGRLRRNAFCGMNLAGYALKRAGVAHGWIHHDPFEPGAEDAIRRALSGPQRPRGRGLGVEPTPASRARAADVAEWLSQARIGVIGDHPTGFEPCAYDSDEVRSRFGTTVDAVEMETLFDSARAAPASRVSETLVEISGEVDLQPVDGFDVEPSTRLLCGLRELSSDRGWSAVATRCWPECFTEFGGAACGPQSMLNSVDSVPAMCEADAYGALTALVLQRLTGEPAFVADIADIDADSAVVWHCGLAPLTMAAAPARATTHFARGLPLLNEFALRPGPVTIARLSQSDNRIRLVVGAGEMLDAPRPFEGTSGTVRFGRPTGEIVDTIMSEGLEHHYGVAYGDVTEELVALAGLLDLDVVHL